MTSGNIGPMKFGLPKVPLNQARHSVFRYFSENGYMTGFANDKCEGVQYSEWSIEERLTQNQELGIEDPVSYYRFDHENMAMFCDKNYDTDDDDQFDNTKGHYSIFKRCFYGQEAHLYNFQYARQFW